jgi:hypothetical protein
MKADERFGGEAARILNHVGIKCSASPPGRFTSEKEFLESRG